MSKDMIYFVLKTVIIMELEYVPLMSKPYENEHYVSTANRPICMHFYSIKICFIINF